MLCIVKISQSIRLCCTVALFSCGLLAAAPSIAAAADENKSVGGKPGPGATASSATAAPALKFDVQVSTGSGSSVTSSETAAAPLPVAAATPPAAAAQSPTAVLPVAVNTPDYSDDPSLSPEQRVIFEALDGWQRENLRSYTYNIAALYDPFMPIKEVRGKPNGASGGFDGEDEANLPPILKLDLSQLKLVAITSVSGRSDSSLASFEDGAGSSYILRQSDRIGRRKGRIVKIDPTQVIVEEAPRGNSKEPEVTVMKLNVLDNSGLSLTGGGN